MWGTIMDAVQQVPVVGDITTVAGVLSVGGSLILGGLGGKKVKRVGKSIGQLLKVVFGQRLKEAQAVAGKGATITQTMDDLMDGIREGLK